MSGAGLFGRGRFIAALLLAAGASASQGGRRDVPPVDELMQGEVFALLTIVPEGRDIDRAALLRDLVELGAPLAPIAAGILCGEIAVPDTAYGSDGAPVDPRLVELRDGLLREALGRLDAGLVVDHLALRAGGEAPLEVRLCVARLLGATRHPRALDVLVQIAAQIEPIQLERSYVRQSFEQPLAAAFAHDARAGAELAARFARHAPEVRALVLRAAVQSDSPGARQFLVTRLAGDGEQALVALGAIAAAPVGAFQVAPEDLYAVRSHLRSLEPGLPRLAALALGKLEDRDSIPELIDLLDSMDGLEARAAHDALRWISGSDAGRTSEEWRRWHLAEESWWSAAAPERIAELSSGDRLTVHRALVDLQRHPAFRHDVAPQVARLILEDDEVLAVAGCNALAALGSSEALPALLEALELPEGEVRDAVLRTLQVLARHDTALREHLAARG